jgi:hypothetical protein
MLRKFVVALAAGALIVSFSLAPTPADAAKKKRAKVARVAPAPAPNLGACVAGIFFLPVKLLAKQPLC